MKITITTPERQFIKNYPVQYLKLSTEEKGQITILDGHSDYIATLATGVISFVGFEDKKQYLGAISSGFIKISNNHASILVNTLELSDEIDLDRVQKSKAKSEEMLKKITDPAEFDLYNKKLNKALARIEATTIGH